MEEDEDEPAMLVSVAEKALQQKCKPETLSYCPSMDLVALATEDEQLHVFRLNGQRVFGASYTALNVQISHLKWKPNGHLIAVGCSDNRLRLFSAYSGKNVHQLNPVTPLGSKLSTLGWTVKFADSKATHKQVQDSKGDVSLDHLLTPTLQPIGSQQLKTDLPRELALLDLESSLPKLSTLPATGDENDVFSSRASIDSIFHSNKGNISDSVDVSLAGFNDGIVDIRIFDCFDIGSINIADSVAPSKSCNLLYHASHPFTSTDSMVVALESSKDEELRLVTLDLRFISSSSRYLALLASKSTQLQNLLRYIKQVQGHIVQEWTTSQDLPTKYIRNINEELTDKHNCDFVTAAYHLLVTGDCSETMKDFLVDQVGERGHKRWEKAVVTGYETIRRLTHECLLPALERCAVLLSRLQGLSKFQNSGQLLGLGTTQIVDCLALVDCLNLLGHQLLLQSGRELRQFVCFAKWLRQEIDLQAADPTSSSADDNLERNENTDYAQVLDYIQGAMTRSALLRFFEVPHADSVLRLTTDDGSGTTLYYEYKEALENNRNRFGADDIQSVRLNDFTSNLKSRCEKMFSQIAETQKRSILVSSPLRLSEDSDSGLIDMKMCIDDDNNLDASSIYIAVRSRKNTGKVCLYHILLEIVNGVSSVKNKAAAVLEFPSAHVKDFKFVDNEDMMLLLSKRGSSLLVSVPFRAKSGHERAPSYSTWSTVDMAWENVTESSVLQIDLARSSMRHQYVRHIFPPDAKRVPLKMEVNGRKGRRVICILYEDRLHYSVFDLDSDARDDVVEEEVEDAQNRGGDEIEMVDAD